MMIQPPADYAGFYSRLASEDIKSDVAPAYYKNAQRDRLIKLCGDTDGKIVLEIGIGKDPLITHLKKCSRCVAVDIAEEYLNRLPSDIVAWHGLAEEMPYKNLFDLIVCSDVLEHVLNPDALLLSIRRALRSDGRVIIKTPFKEDLLKYTGTKWDGCHLRTFDKESLEKTLVRNGLRLISFRYNGFVCGLHQSPKIIRYLNYSFTPTHTLGLMQRIIVLLPAWLPLLLGYQPIEITVVAVKQ